MPAGAGRQAARWLEAHKCTLLQGRGAMRDSKTVVVAGHEGHPMTFDRVFRCAGAGGPPAPYLASSTSPAVAAALQRSGRVRVDANFAVAGTDSRLFAVGDLCDHPAHLMQTAHMAKWTARSAAAAVAAAGGKSPLWWRAWPAYLWSSAARWPPVYCVSLGQHAAVIVVNRTALPRFMGENTGGLAKALIEVMNCRFGHLGTWTPGHRPRGQQPRPAQGSCCADMVFSPPMCLFTSSPPRLPSSLRSAFLSWQTAGFLQPLSLGMLSTAAPGPLARSASFDPARGLAP